MSLASTLPTDLPHAPTSKRARSSKATSRQGSAVAARPRKVSFYLSAEAVRKLGVVASMEDTDKSKILERIIAEAPSLKRWVVSDRAKPSDQETMEVSTD
jgi:hypothetical protein